METNKIKNLSIFKRMSTFLVTGAFVLGASGCDGKKVGETTETEIAGTSISAETESSKKTSEENVKNESSKNSDLTDNSISGYPVAIVNLSAEDILKRAYEFTGYVNEVGDFKNSNITHGLFNITDMYSVIYLANIDYVGAEETKRLIDGGYIADDMKRIRENAFTFLAFYVDDTVFKIREGNTNIIDISKTMMVDQKGMDAVSEMNKVITSFPTNDEETNKKNFIDTLFYVSEGVELNKGTYDFSKSVYNSDKEELNIGSDWVVDYTADCIEWISLENGFLQYGDGVYNTFNESIHDDSDLERVFAEYTSKENCYTKTK